MQGDAINSPKKNGRCCQRQHRERCKMAYYLVRFYAGLDRCPMSRFTTQRW